MDLYVRSWVFHSCDCSTKSCSKARVIQQTFPARLFLQVSSSDKHAWHKPVKVMCPSLCEHVRVACGWAALENSLMHTAKSKTDTAGSIL